MRQRRADDPEKARASGRVAAAKRRSEKREQVRTADRAFYHALSPEEKLQRGRKNRAASKASIRRAASRWAGANPGKKNAETAKRRARLKEAMPPWADRDSIRAIYIECARVSRETGVAHHVDHIHPLHGRFASGLHVHWNLQILTAEENARKSNKAP